MENTGQVLFADDVPQWYVACGERWKGPLTASDVYRKVLSQEITWAHYVWKPGKAGWERICDLPDFQSAVPPLPTQDIRQEVKEAARPSVTQKAVVRSSSRSMVAEKSKAASESSRDSSRRGSEEEEASGIWFLYYQDAQSGPFRGSEMVGFIQTGRVDGSVFAWQDGMENWERLDRIDYFQKCFEKPKKKGPPPPPARASVGSPKSSISKSAAQAAATLETVRSAKKSDQRGTPRRPLVAKILMAKEDQVVTAVCRDISIGGLQVLTDRVPGKVGARIKMNVSAVGKRMGKTKIEPFVAEGVIVRILEDGRGFSFRFERLSESAKRAIEAYIAANG